MSTEKELEERISELEAEVHRQSYYADMVAIQNLQSRYIFYMENGNISGVWDDLYSHTNPDVRVEIMDSGAYIGQEHVKRVWYTMGKKMDKSGKMVDPILNEMSNTNSRDANMLLTLLLMTPLIEVSDDRTQAWGQWHLFGPHTNKVWDPEAMEKKDTAFWICGKYDNEYVKEDGEWKIKSLRPICWLRSPYDKGWLREADCRRTPPPYMPYDEPPRVSSWNPDAPFTSEQFGPLPHEHIVHKLP